MLFRNFLPLEKGGHFICTNLNPLHPRMLCAKFGWNLPSGSVEEDFYISTMYFCFFIIISPWKRAWPFICINLNPLNPRMLFAKFGWNWPTGSGEEDENVKNLRQQQQGRQQQTTDKLWSEKLTWAFASGELKRTYEEAQTPLLQIRVSYYLGGVEVKYFVFDAVGATKTDWFSRSRLLETNYDITALTTAVGKSGEYFSIAG